MVLIDSLVLPLTIFSVLQNKIPIIYALLLSGLPPVLEVFINIAATGILDFTSIVSLMSIGLSILLLYISADPRALLVKDSFVTGLFGLGFLGSLFLKENLTMRYMRLMAGSDYFKQRDYDLKFLEASYIHHTKVISIVWGVGLTFESILRIVLIFFIPLTTMFFVSFVIGFGFWIGLATWNFIYVSRLKHEEIEKPVISHFPNNL
ncbi:hypothetical protein BC833DRAFT_568068 [Globomyces pollinis-pini]|nr:hypothetical protein BC833DRAFT_568068 [Globomyces pollinis-pini]